MSIDRCSERSAIAATTPTRLSSRLLILSEFASLTKSLRGWVLERLRAGLSVESKEVVVEP
jgi:hypothetical protein